MPAVIDEHTLSSPSIVGIGSASSIIISVEHLEFSGILDPVLRHHVILNGSVQKVSAATQRQMRHMKIHIAAPLKIQRLPIHEIGGKDTSGTFVPIHHEHHAHILKHGPDMAVIVYANNEMLPRNSGLDRVQLFIQDRDPREP